MGYGSAILKSILVCMIVLPAVELTLSYLHLIDFNILFFRNPFDAPAADPLAFLNNLIQGFNWLLWLIASTVLGVVFGLLFGRRRRRRVGIRVRPMEEF